VSAARALLLLRAGRRRHSSLSTAPGARLRSEPRGIGFVEFADKRDAADCIDSMNGMTINGRTVSRPWGCGRRCSCRSCWS
jgi:RNA recognition motif-containing protein